jgi:hypothetical protein
MGREWSEPDGDSRQREDNIEMGQGAGRGALRIGR